MPVEQLTEGWMGLSRSGFYTGMYCSQECADQAGEHQTERITSEELADEENPDLWYDTEDGCRMPLFGHCCSNNMYCEEIVWD